MGEMGEWFQTGAILGLAVASIVQGWRIGRLEARIAWVKWITELDKEARK